jgi:hypothetical protein
MYFVWITGLRGPSPQIWAEDQLDSATGKSKSILVKIKLDRGDDFLSLDQLSKKYPFTVDKETDRN